MYLKKRAARCTYIKDFKRWELIMDRGFPYPWYFHEAAESEFAGQDYEQHWAVQKEIKKSGVSAKEASLTHKLLKGHQP
tara:strand:+ start:127 stop:363 length:237 start_codon:yes stop_codon:yes gene_type:complete